MPPLPFDVVDPHIHLFDLKGTPRPMQPLGRLFGWNERALRFMATRLMPKPTIDYFGRSTDLLGDWMPAHLRDDSRPSGVVRYVHIEAGWKDDDPMDPVGETAWLDGLPDGPAAIVGHVDMTLGAAVDPILTAHGEASARFRGIRHSLSNHPSESVMVFAEDPEMSRTSEFRAAYDALAEHQLSFEAWCFSGQLGQVAELARSNPDVPLVLCHAGTPVGWAGEFHGVGVSEQERARIDDEWREGLAAVAERSHVRCKLSGLLMPCVGFGYEDAVKRPTTRELVDRLGPIVQYCLELFGPDRCMVASNFPVDRVSADYGTVFDAMVELTSSLGEDAQRQLFHDTAATFYRI